MYKRNSRCSLLLFVLGCTPPVEATSIPTVAAQAAFLDWSEFDAADIDARYAGQTDYIVETVEAMMAADFAGWAVTFCDDPVGDVLRLFFGGLHPLWLGRAECIGCDRATVFVESFAAFMPLAPTVRQMAVAIANVAAHELGHLLGLGHADDGVMSVTATGRELLRDRTLLAPALY